MPSLEISGNRIPVGQDNFVIGADTYCHLRLTQTGVAPRHLILQQVGGAAWHVATLNLGAKTTLNGAMLDRIRVLRNGDELQLGQARIRWWDDVTQGALSAGGRWQFGRAQSWLILLLFVIVLTLIANAVWFNSLFLTGQQSELSAPASTGAEEIRLQPQHIDVVATLSAEGLRVGITTSDLSDGAQTSTLPEEGLLLTPASPTVDVVAPAVAPQAAEGITLSACKTPAGWMTIMVRQGDSLATLAARYGISAQEMQAVNCLDSDRIRPGDRLLAPRPTGLAPSAPSSSP